MSRMRFSLNHKILTASAVAILLLCAPLHLAAQEREAPSGGHVSALEWFSGLWSDLTAWFSGEVKPPLPEPPSETQGDNGCAVDPHGVCGG